MLFLFSVDSIQRHKSCDDNVQAWKYATPILLSATFLECYFSDRNGMLLVSNRIFKFRIKKFRALPLGYLVRIQILWWKEISFRKNLKKGAMACHGVAGGVIELRSWCAHSFFSRIFIWHICCHIQYAYHHNHVFNTFTTDFFCQHIYFIFNSPLYSIRSFFFYRQ